MNTGLLWYDGDPERDLETKVERATRRYHTKFGRWPNTCHAHPAAVGDVGNAGAKVMIKRPGPSQYVPPVVVRVVPSPRILRDHFWIGCEEPS